MKEDIFTPIENVDDKDQKIGKMISELEAINYEVVESDALNYSNDSCVSRFIPKIVESSDKIPGEIRTVIIVGSGPLWNIPRALTNIDLIISLDINKNQLDRNKTRKQEILLAKSTKELLPSPNPNIENSDIVVQAQEKRKMKAAQVEIEAYGNYHYLSSVEELRKAQEHLKKAKFAYVCGDIADKEFTSQLRVVLKSSGANIVFADLSNVSEWVCGSKPDPNKRDSLINSLNLLPIDEKCPILHSRSTGQIGRSPIVSKLSLGTRDYGESLMDRTGLYKLVE
jgi:hypothetical protein